MSAAVLENVIGDLFVGETRMFFQHPRFKRRSPYRVETATSSGSGDEPVSFEVRVFNADMVVLCDSRLNAKRVVDTLYATDIGHDTNVPAFDPDNARRWTNLVETADGRHWSEGEDSSRTQTPNYCGSERPAASSSVLNVDRTLKEQRQRPARITVIEETAISRLRSQLPREAAEAVMDGRSVVVCRTSNLLDHCWNGVVGDCNHANQGCNHANHQGCTCADGLRVRRLARSFNNHVYALCHGTTGGGGGGGDTTALLFVGRFWPREIAGGSVVKAEGICQQHKEQRPLLTVVRKRDSGRVGGRVFCICLGSHLAKRLHDMSAEQMAKSKRHYEGYFSIGDYNYCSRTTPVRYAKCSVGERRCTDNDREDGAEVPDRHRPVVGRDPHHLLRQENAGGIAVEASVSTVKTAGENPVAAAV